MHMCYDTGVEVRGQLVGVSFLLPPHDSWELHLGHQAWYSVPLGTQISP